MSATTRTAAGPDVRTDASPDVRQLSRPSEARTFFIWMGLCLLGIPLAGYLGWGVAGHVDGVTPALIGGALTGAGIGFAQWLLLRRSLGVGPEWIVATSAGLAVGLAIGAVVVGYETTTSQLAIMGAIQGAFVGIAQGLVLRNKFSLWRVWMVAMPVFFSIAWVVTDGVIDSGKQFTVFGASGAVVFAILSGLLLMAGIRRGKSANA
jgi:hypothetical protein